MFYGFVTEFAKFVQYFYTFCKKKKNVEFSVEAGFCQVLTQNLDFFFFWC